MADDKTCCGGRTHAQWRQLLSFYTLFYAGVVAFWAICFVVMINTQPPLADGPKTQFVLSPSGLPFPTRISAVLSNLVPSLEGEYTQLDKFIERDGNTLSLGDFSKYGACEVVLSGNYSSVYENNQACVFMSMSRTFHQPQSDVSTELYLDFPSEAEFQTIFGVTFADFVASSVQVTPSTFTNTVAFGSGVGKYEDLVSAIFVDYSQFAPSIMSGDLIINIRFGLRFKDASGAEVAKGTVDFDVTM